MDGKSRSTILCTTRLCLAKKKSPMAKLKAKLRSAQGASSVPTTTLKKTSEIQKCLSNNETALTLFTTRSLKCLWTFRTSINCKSLFLSKWLSLWNHRSNKRKGKSSILRTKSPSKTKKISFKKGSLGTSLCIAWSLEKSFKKHSLLQ